MATRQVENVFARRRSRATQRQNLSDLLKGEAESLCLPNEREFLDGRSAERVADAVVDDLRRLTKLPLPAAQLSCA